MILENFSESDWSRSRNGIGVRNKRLRPSLISVLYCRLQILWWRKLKGPVQFFNAGCNEQLFSTEKNLAQIRLVVFEKIAKPLTPTHFIPKNNVTEPKVRLL